MWLVNVVFVRCETTQMKQSCAQQLVFTIVSCPLARQTADAKGYNEVVSTAYVLPHSNMLSRTQEVVLRNVIDQRMFRPSETFLNFLKES